jgi:chromosome segregation ATPase
MYAARLSEIRGNFGSILTELSTRHPNSVSWLRTLHGYLKEISDALAEAQATIAEKDSELEAAYKTFYRQKNELEQAQATITKAEMDRDAAIGDWAVAQAELSRLRADAKRLDWLISIVTADGADVLANARATIDAEMAAQEGASHAE